jgi:hypothetical protein
MSITVYTVYGPGGEIVGKLLHNGKGYNPCNADGYSLCYGAYLPGRQNAYDVVVTAAKEAAAAADKQTTLPVGDAQ